MNTINYLGVVFFGFSAIMLAYLGARFFKIKKQPMVHFGAGLLSVSLAFLIWAYIVAVQPSNLQVMVIVGIVPFFASFILFLLAAMHDIKTEHRFPFIAVSSVILVGFVILRFFVYESNPGFTANGFFAFNVDPIVLYFYAMITAFNFIPAVYVVGRRITHDLLRVFVELGLTLAAIGLIIMITSQDENLQIVNGIGIAIGLLSATIAAAIYSPRKYIE